MRHWNRFGDLCAITANQGEWVAYVNGNGHSPGEGLAGTLPPQELIFGLSSAMRLVRQKVDKVARANVPILIQGPGGSGKEILARWIHYNSSSASGQFVKVNCAAIPGTLLESELFGYEPGAFTGANGSKPGRIEMAHGGTLFLDGIAEIEHGLQAKLLHFLQEGSFCRIGDHEQRHVDARIICVTNRILQDEIDKGNFRADLFYRINVVQIAMPPLKDRLDDIPDLANYFLGIYNTRFQRVAPELPLDVIHLLKTRDWPGNIRELENRLARYVLLGPEDFIPKRPERRSFRAPIRASEDGSIPLKRITQEAVREMERDLILSVLEANRWNRRKTADALKISYRALIYKIREAGLLSERAPGLLRPSLSRDGARSAKKPGDR